MDPQYLAPRLINDEQTGRVLKENERNDALYIVMSDSAPVQEHERRDMLQEAMSIPSEEERYDDWENLEPDENEKRINDLREKPQKKRSSQWVHMYPQPRRKMRRRLKVSDVLLASEKGIHFEERESQMKFKPLPLVNTPPLLDGLHAHCTYLLSSLLSLSLCSVASCTITGAFVVPHGGIVLAPDHFNTTNATAKEQAWALHKNYKLVGKRIDDLKPDVIFLSTPHGVADSDRFVLYLNSAGQGNADTDNIQCPPTCFNVSANFAYDISEDIVNTYKNKLNLSGLSAFGPPGRSDLYFPLRWGEVIPLYAIPNLSRVQVIVMSQPSRRYTESVAMIPELLELGKHLYKYLHSLDQTVIVIVSADLAHTHQKDGPYGYSDAAEPFDQACGHWAETMDSNGLLITAAKYVDKALSCGYTGMVMLHGMLAAGQLSSWIPTLYANYHPSYYGMMLASFLPH